MIISYRRILILMTIVVLIFTNILTIGNSFIEASSNSNEIKTDVNRSWIIKWKDQPDPAFNSFNSQIIEEMPQFNAVVAQAAENENEQLWVQEWKNSNYVDYIQINSKVHIQAKPNDPLYPSQQYLQQIKAEEAWNIAAENTELTIAIVDTGIDLAHPDLINNLVAGKNLINPDEQPQDDNGHGTNVAGIIAAAGNNSSGISGLLWKTKVMPIKSLEADGSGDESKLGEGIRYAVDNGAKIVVLSLGLYKYSPFMDDIVKYAEDRGVLLVAAAGNDGEAVKYPAAYPTVMAVGGVNAKSEVMSASNFGSEVDVVAPWYVYTTSLGGEFGTNGGTSMATPQVAAVAALIWAKHPDLKPYQVRNLIRQTAQDIGPRGWDNRSGYGLLRADHALTAEIQEDIYEENNSLATAKPMPLGSMLSGTLDGGTDQDWFSLTTSYDGYVNLQFLADEQGNFPPIEITHISQGTVYSNLTTPIKLYLPKGQNLIKINTVEATAMMSLHYRLIPTFQIFRDAFEDNDRQFKSYLIPGKTQSIRGNFHQKNDEDWYLMSVEEAGSLQVILSTDTNRIDPELMIQKIGEKAVYYDSFAEGLTEYASLDILPGKYYVRVRNTISEDAYPVNGEYDLMINYAKKFVDPNEPNNRAFQAKVTSFNTSYKGVFDSDNDTDWFSFKVGTNKYTTIDLDHIPNNRVLSMTLLDSSQKELAKVINSLGTTKSSLGIALPAGTYYIRLSANQGFVQQMYDLKITNTELISGYRDITDHWAQADIIFLTELEIVKGYDDNLFKPDKDITRAEAVVMIVDALKITGTKSPSFKDVNSSHWAYKQISIAKQSGMINGYPDRTFKPDQPTKRVEMVIMLANALGIVGVDNNLPIPFDDIDENYWALNILKQMEAEGWIKGYDDGTFKPNNLATRAQFAAFIARVVR